MSRVQAEEVQFTFLEDLQGDFLLTFCVKCFLYMCLATDTDCLLDPEGAFEIIAGLEIRLHERELELLG